MIQAGGLCIKFKDFITNFKKKKLTFQKMSRKKIAS